MSDTPIPTNPGEQPEEASNVQAFRPPVETAEGIVLPGDEPTPIPVDVTKERPTLDEPEGEDIREEAVAPETEAAQPRSIEARLLDLGPAGGVLLEILSTVADTLESAGKPQLVAGTFGFLMDVSKDPTRVEYGCLATQFGNDLLLKGLAATIAEQQAAKNVENQRRAMQRPQGNPMLESLLAALKKSSEAAQDMEPTGRFPGTGVQVDALCDDPSCEACTAARESLGIPQLPAAGPIGGPDAGPEAPTVES